MARLQVLLDSGKVRLEDLLFEFFKKFASLRLNSKDFFLLNSTLIFSKLINEIP